MLRLRQLALAALTAVTVLALTAAPAAADTATFEHPAGPASSAMDHIYRAVLGVTVTAQQFSFGYAYGANSGIEGKSPSNASTLVVPVSTPVKVEVRSKDVDHDWWVPALGPKIDAIPGQTNTTWFKADHTGTY